MGEINTRVRRPFGVSEVIALTATGVQAVTIEQGGTEIDGVTTEATGNRTINITLGRYLERDDRVVVRVKNNGTETTTFGTNVTAPVVTGVAGKTFTLELRYNGTAFEQIGAAVQID